MTRDRMNRLEKLLKEYIAELKTEEPLAAMFVAEVRRRILDEIDEAPA